MTLNLCMPEVADLKPKLTVFGIGGAGGNAINNMIEKSLEGVDFVVANTDAQALQNSQAPHKLQLGVKLTEGLGAGARPEVGCAAAQESIEVVKDFLSGCHMCFITAGMGGGTGTGAAPVIAEVARELGVLTVGVVTKPFDFEGVKRMRHAREGVERLQEVVDTLIIIPNQNLFRIANEKTTFTDAFALADDVLYQGVKGVTDLMVKPGLINLDFADIRSVMDEMGKAMMGTGEADGENRAVQAAENAISNPLLDDISFKGARGVLINITGGMDMTLFEVDEAANRIRKEMDSEANEANIIVGSTLDANMDGLMRVSVVATGIDSTAAERDAPVPRRSLSKPLEAPVHAHAEESVTAPQPQAAAEPVQEASPPPAAVSPSAETAFADPAATGRPPHGGIADYADDQPPFAATGDFHHATQDSSGAAGGFRPEEEQAWIDETAPVDAGGHPDQTFARTEPPVTATAGEPSPETLERLWHLVERQPEGTARSARDEPKVVNPPVSRTRGVSAGKGLNGLISRMTGGPDSAHEGHGGSAGLHRQDPPAARARAGDFQDEQSEIPAFLRRQAN